MPDDVPPAPCSTVGIATSTIWPSRNKPRQMRIVAYPPTRNRDQTDG
jgi:hypothetical protein